MCACRFSEHQHHHQPGIARSVLPSRECQPHACCCPLPASARRGVPPAPHRPGPPLRNMPQGGGQPLGCRIFAPGLTVQKSFKNRQHWNSKPESRLKSKLGGCHPGWWSPAKSQNFQDWHRRVASILVDQHRLTTKRVFMLEP